MFLLAGVYCISNLIRSGYIGDLIDHMTLAFVVNYNQLPRRSQGSGILKLVTVMIEGFSLGL